MFIEKYPEKLAGKYLRQCPQPCARLRRDVYLHLCLCLYLYLNPKPFAESYREKFEKLFHKKFRKSFALLFPKLFELKYRQLWVLSYDVTCRQTLPGRALQ